MNPVDPNENPELVALHRALLDNDCTVKEKGDSVEYSYPCMGGNSSLGAVFDEAARKLVPDFGGKVTMNLNSIKTGGFIAAFPDDEKRMAFLIAFGKAAEKLNIPPKLAGIKVMPDGMVMGAGAKPRRGVYG
jgi:hypothetical protein